MKIDMQPVSSSNVAAVGHDPRNNTLRVSFKNGGTYSYGGVSAAQHKALMSADSVGAHLAAHIKPKHQATKL